MLHAFDAMSKLYGSNRYPNNRYKNHSNSKLYEMWKSELINYIKDNKLHQGKNNSHYGSVMYYNMETKSVKYIKDGENIPDGFVKGAPPWITHNGSKNKTWVHNIKTNQQIYIDNDILEIFLINNPEYVKGVSPLSRVHIQQFNPSKGKVWITNIQQHQSKYFDKSNSLPDGWLFGRVTNEEYYSRYEDALNQQKEWCFIDLDTDIKLKRVPKLKRVQIPKNNKSNKKRKQYKKKNIKPDLRSDFAKLSKEQKIELLRQYHEVYVVEGFNGVVKKFNYKYSIQNLVGRFAKYLPEFTPQNGKKRCIN